MRLTKRDLAILEAVYEYRVLSAKQIQQLFFPYPTGIKTARTRLQKLYHHGLVDRKFSGVYFDKMNSPILYVLDKRGAEFLKAAGKFSQEWKRKSKQVGLLFLNHAIAINEVRIAVEIACREFGFEILKWSGEQELKASYDRVNVAGVAEPIAVIPDSYFALRTPKGVMHFFLEVDRSTETNKVFRRKIRAYQVYCGSLEAKNRFETNKFRVLTVTANNARLQNLKRSTEASGGKSRFWFTTAAQINPQQVLRGSIWRVAGRNNQISLIA